jgi:hypothetical protein
MSEGPSENDKQEPHKVGHFLADWWIYAVLAAFIGGLVFLTYAVVLRGEVMTDFGKPGARTAPPPGTAGK